MDINANNNFSYYSLCDSDEENNSNFGSPQRNLDDDLPSKSSHLRHRYSSTPVLSQEDFPEYNSDDYNESNNRSPSSYHYDDYYTQQRGVHYSAPHHAGSGASSITGSDSEDTGDSEAYGDSESYGYVNGFEGVSVAGPLDFEQFRWHMQQRLPNVHCNSDVLSVLNSAIKYIQELADAAEAKARRLDSDSLSEDLYRLNFH